LGGAIAISKILSIYDLAVENVKTGKIDSSRKGKLMDGSPGYNSS